MKQDLEESQKVLETYKYELNPTIVSKYKKYIESKKFLDNEPKYNYNPNNNLDDLIQLKNHILHNETLPDDDPEVVKENIEKIRAYNTYKKLKSNYDVYENKITKLETYSVQLEKSKPSIEQIRSKIYKLLNIDDFSNIDNIISNFKHQHFNCPKCKINLTIKKDKLCINNVILSESEKKFIIEGVLKIKNYENNIEICDEKIKTLKSLLDQVIEPEEVEKTRIY